MNRSTTTQSRGVTLIELMVTVAIVGILAAIVLPSYQGYMQKTRRSDCKATLDEIAYALHRCRGTYAAFNDPECIALANSVTSEDGYYEIDFSAGPTANSFTIQCTPQAGTPQDQDEQCARMSVNEAGVTQARDSGGNLNTALCW